MRRRSPPHRPPADEEEAAEKVERDYTVEVDSRRFTVKVIGPPPTGGGVVPRARTPWDGPRRAATAAAGSDGAASGSVVSPLQGTVLRVNVKKGQEVEEGAVVCVIEAMKMENEITAPVAGKVEELNVSEGACGRGRRRIARDQIAPHGRLDSWIRRNPVRVALRYA